MSGKEALYNSTPELEHTVTDRVPLYVAAVCSLFPTCTEMLQGREFVKPSDDGVISTDAPVSPIQMLGSVKSFRTLGNSYVSAISRQISVGFSTSPPSNMS
jgi:hypothetical protein